MRCWALQTPEDRVPDAFGGDERQLAQKQTEAAKPLVWFQDGCQSEALCYRDDEYAKTQLAQAAFN